MEVTPEMYALLGILLGVLIKTLLPYFQKLQEDPSLLFDWRYVITAGLSGVITAFILMPMFQIPDATPTMIIMQAAVFAFTTEVFLNAYAKSKGTGTILTFNKKARIKRLEAKLTSLRKRVEQKTETTITVDTT
jgi:hypothetical protein